MAVIASEAIGGDIPQQYPPRAAVISWIFFDWAAQPYFTLITTFVFAPYFASFVALGRMDHHEAAAADISGARIGDGHRKAGRDRGVDGVAALPQNVGADFCRESLLRDHHAVFGGNGMNAGEVRRRIDLALLRNSRHAGGTQQHEG